jgi:hypothetical protein
MAAAPRPTPKSYPVRPLGRCPTCPREIYLAATGFLHRHGTCPPANPEALPDTFARWLYTHARRRDAWTNPITQLAQREFGEPRGCSPPRHPSGVTWTTAEELHRKHHGDPDAACTWQCEDVAVAAAHYEQHTRQAAPPA